VKKTRRPKSDTAQGGLSFHTILCVCRVGWPMRPREKESAGDKNEGEAGLNWDRKGADLLVFSDGEFSPNTGKKELGGEQRDGETVESIKFTRSGEKRGGGWRRGGITKKRRNCCYGVDLLSKVGDQQTGRRHIGKLRG